MTPEVIRQTIIDDGYIYLSEVAENSIEKIAESLGRIEIDKRNPIRIRDIRPETQLLAKPNTLSSRYGLGGFPFHTDCAHWGRPAKYLLLYCVNPGSGNRPTLLIDTGEWVWSLADGYALCNQVWKRALRKPRLCTVAERTSSGLSYRFDEACMAPMTKGAERTLEQIRSRIINSEPKTIIWESGSLLVLDNYRILHARGTSIRIDRDRLLKRVLVGVVQ